ncbi:MAG: hypothetical protein QXS20_07170 [Candidatus Thorarchaeota archaeon]
MKNAHSEAKRVTCSEDSNVIEIKCGEEFYYQFGRHASVGEEAEFEIEDTSVVTHIDTELKYRYPERMKPGWTGGDSQTGRWFFKGDRPGETKIHFRELFRGRLERECVLTVVVRD